MAREKIETKFTVTARPSSAAVVEEPAKKSTRKKKATSTPVAPPPKAVEGTVIYVGRIPHGFYEHQLRSFLSQFGHVVKVRVSRNKITGNSKHYGFVQFAEPEVAKIVVETMHNYLLAGSLLQCRIIPPEQVHPSLFKGANRPFQVIPWQQLRIQRHNEAVDRRLALKGQVLVVEDAGRPEDQPFEGWKWEGAPATEEEELLRQALEIIEPSPATSNKRNEKTEEDREKETALTVQRAEHRRQRVNERMQKRAAFMNDLLNQ